MDQPFCLVTGGTSGIGRAVARQLAQRGFHVLLTGRDRVRGETVVSEIRSAGNGAGNAAEFLPVDFGSLASVRALADEVQRRCDWLPLLVNNAGMIGSGQRRVTADGFEETFAVNHLATFLLTERLRPLLAAGAPARVVTVSSDAHRAMSAMDWDDLQAERRYKPMRAYCQSKLANVLFTYELARRLEKDGITATCLHPGVVRTAIWDEAGGILGSLGRLARPFMISAERSAASVTRLASAPELAGATGRYFHRNKEATSSPATRDPVAAARLWEISEGLVAR